MVNIKKQKTQEEKDAITVEKKVLQGESKKAIEVFNKNTPLEDTKLPFQVSGDLSFVVQSVKISNVSGGALKFTITVRISWILLMTKESLAREPTFISLPLTLKAR